MTRAYRRPDQIAYEVLNILNNSKTILRTRTRGYVKDIRYGMLGKNKLINKSGLACHISRVHINNLLDGGMIEFKSVGYKNYYCITDPGVNHLNELSKKFKPNAPQDILTVIKN